LALAVARGNLGDSKVARLAHAQMTARKAHDLGLGVHAHAAPRLVVGRLVIIVIVKTKISRVKRPLVC